VANKLKSKDLRKLNINSDKTISIALVILNKHYKHNTNEERIEVIKEIIENPEEYIGDSVLSKIAHEFYESIEHDTEVIPIEERDIELNVFGH
jgi:tRNA-splicing ligase RtcB